MKSREEESRGKTGQGVEMAVHLINTRRRKRSHQKTRKFKVLYNFIINTIKPSHWAFENGAEWHFIRHTRRTWYVVWRKNDKLVQKRVSLDGIPVFR